MDSQIQFHQKVLSKVKAHLTGSCHERRSSTQKQTSEASLEKTLASCRPEIGEDGE